MNILFEDRSDAGKRLAELLEAYRGRDALIVALPRGGVPIAYEISKHLLLPFDVFVVRKIGAPKNPEYAIGAISESGAVLLDNDAIAQLHINQGDIDEVVSREELEITRRVRAYRAGKPFPHIEGKTVFVIDDGVATGFTARAAIQSMKMMSPQEIIFAAPVCAEDTVEQFEREGITVVSLANVKKFKAVGQFYQNFQAVTDDQVRDLLFNG